MNEYQVIFAPEAEEQPLALYRLQKLRMRSLRSSTQKVLSTTVKA